MMKNRASVLFATLLALAAATSWAGVAVSTNSEGVILNGYDAVSYFTLSKAVPGDRGITAEHDGATYRFSTTANRDTFLANPDRFVPAYGGHCAYGASLGKKFAVDGTAFEIVDGVLYVNKNLKVYKTWKKDIPENITKADRQWPGIRDTPADEL